jgi:hypothetical protein
MPKRPGASREVDLEEFRTRLEALLEKAMVRYGSEAVATLLVDLAGRARDIFVAEVSRQRDDWDMRRPRGSA